VSGPLAARTILVTRPRAGRLRDLLERLGASVVEAPTVALEPVEPGGRLDAAVLEASKGDCAWVAFTSAAGVEAWFDRTEALRADGPRSRVAAIGSGTARALRSRNVEPDLVPVTYTTEALGDSFPEGNGRILLPRADIAPEGLEEVLRDRGWTPVRVDAYRTRLADALPEEARHALREGRVDAVTFTSASTVEGFERLAGSPSGPAVVCIGPVTAAAAFRAGLEVDAVAEPHTLDGLADATVRALGLTPGPG
jgi:uroporphyrinogen-III synthase